MQAGREVRFTLSKTQTATAWRVALKGVQLGAGRLNRGCWHDPDNLTEGDPGSEVALGSVQKPEKDRKLRKMV